MTDRPDSPFNQASTAQGAIDLIADSPFRPLRRTRVDGRWVIRYYFNNEQDNAQIAREERLSRSGLDGESLRPFDQRQRTALQNIIQRLEAVSLVRFIEVSDPAQADMDFLAVNYRDGGLGQVRNHHSGHTQVIVANRLNTERERLGIGLGVRPGFNEGEVGYGTLMHEMLHAMGLRHPRNWFTYRNGRNGTVMHYQGEGRGDDNELGRYDIAALQHLYGMPEHLARRIGLPESVTLPGIDTPAIPFSQQTEPQHGLPKMPPKPRAR